MEFALSYSTSFAFVLIASFMWNTWNIALKYLDERYSLDAFVLDLYLFSCPLMWGIGFVLKGTALTAQIAQAWRARPTIIPLILVVGALFSIGVRIGLGIVSSVGLMLTVTVRSSLVILLGTIVSIQVGGMPAGASPGMIFGAALLLLLAMLVGMRASQERKRGSAQLMVQLAQVDWKVIGQSLASGLLIVSYAYGLSFGVRSTSHPQGMDAAAYMALLSTGSLIGTLIWSGGRLTFSRQWAKWLRAPVRYRQMAIACAVAHFGGNLMHAIGVPALSTAIAWPLGTAGNLWTYLWGLVFGEFKGAPRKAWVLLGTTVILFIAGSALLSLGQYSR